MRLYLSRTEQYIVAILLIAILGALLVLSYAYGVKGKNAPLPPLYESTPTSANGTAPAQSVSATDQITVHVTGAVQKPGVYTFAPGTRISDAIQRAGGARPDGYPDALNLAAKLEDGEKIYVPTKAEWEKSLSSQGPPPLVQSSTGSTKSAKSSAPASSTTGSASPQNSGPKPLPTGKVSLNTATKEQLMTLPGIGEVTAQRIIDYRTQHGKFTDLSQLLNVPRIGAKTLENLTPYLQL